jgi:hypothetical protein
MESDPADIANFYLSLESVQLPLSPLAHNFSTSHDFPTQSPMDHFKNFPVNADIPKLCDPTTNSEFLISQETSSPIPKQDNQRKITAWTTFRPFISNVSSKRTTNSSTFQPNHPHENFTEHLKPQLSITQESLGYAKYTICIFYLWRLYRHF